MKNKAPEIFKKAFSKKKNVKIKLLGDSITHGEGGSGWKQSGEVIVAGWLQSPNGYSWANLFRDYMKEKYGATVINKACSGTNVQFIMEHFSALVDSDDDIIVCAIGTNNRNFHFLQGEKPTREEHLKNVYENVIKLYNKFLENDKPVIFVANIPASEENEKKDGADYWRVIHMADINNIYKHLSQEYGATVVSLYDLISKYCEEKEIVIDELLSDGLHPNNEGHRIISELLIQAFEV